MDFLKVAAMKYCTFALTDLKFKTVHMTVCVFKLLVSAIPRKLLIQLILGYSTTKG